MNRFIPREKLSKKARRALDSRQRAAWQQSPVTKAVESKKRYNRKARAHVRYDDSGMGVFLSGKGEKLPRVSASGGRRS